jgi:hypothetical protein
MHGTIKGKKTVFCCPVGPPLPPLARSSLGMTLISANTLAIGHIGKDRPPRIIKICFGNMNVIFGSEIALLGFWEYIFRILVTVLGRCYGCILYKYSLILFYVSQH